MAVCCRSVDVSFSSQTPVPPCNHAGTRERGETTPGGCFGSQPFTVTNDNSQNRCESCAHPGRLAVMPCGVCDCAYLLVVAVMPRVGSVACACGGGRSRVTGAEAGRRSGAAPGRQLGRKEGTARAQLEVIPYAVTHDARSTVVILIEGHTLLTSLWVNGMAGLAVHVPAATRVKAETG